MKTIFAAFILIPSLWLSQAASSDGYRKIPEILDNTDYLYPFIIPDKKYEYWAALRKDEKDPLYESQAPLSMGMTDLPSPEQGFFRKCPAGCFSYIIACRSNQPEYFTNEQLLRDFIGYVDNLPEALLIANTYGFFSDSKDPAGGSYKIENDFILMCLAKVKDCPETKESFWIRINRKNGQLESRSNGIYHQSNGNCTGTSP
ncbi:hypothetical protein [Chryseobacterium gossypii]|uniref:hypothetical protein n=1 Tax=Chryseobacterium gossypii TaxID=3231602 RepID=UPI003525B391